VLKIESHNHPSAVEPYQGAATGVGGIVRDIFTMGARPVALLNSLRFGPLDEPRNRYLFSGVVGGIGGYGNCLGVPTVGGDIYFDPAYSGNPLVNAMCVGIARRDELMRARASGPGNLVLIVGAETGRDGVGGATFASVEDPEASHRGVVQVGNPFLEKLLLEACLEVLKTPHVVAMQDLGAAGLTSSTVEVASRGGVGIEIDVAKVPRRETGMNAYEVMLSESQERMLVVVRPEGLDAVRAIFERHDLRCAVIGEVTGDGLVRVRDGDEVVAEVPATLFTDECPTYVREGVEVGQDRGAARPGCTGRAGPGRERGSDAGRGAAPSPGIPEYRQPRAGHPHLRLDDHDQHRGAAAGGRRRGDPRQGNDDWVGHQDRLQPALRVSGSVSGWRACRGRGGAQRLLRRRRADRGDRLPQLR